MSASHKEHKIETLHDIFMLSEEEFQRFLPDLVGWYVASHAAADFVGVTPSAFVAKMLWIDDRENEVKNINLQFGDGKSLDLLDPSTWPKQENK